MMIFRRTDSSRRGVLILVENLPVPFDRRVWQEACTLRDAGYAVSIIGPTGCGYESRFEIRDEIHIYRYGLVEGSTPAGYAREYATALLWTFALTVKVWATRGFDVIHACNPPDRFFVLGALFKLLGKKYVFDHHDINPELYEAKFARRDFFHRVLLRLERLSFLVADVSIASNDSYRRIAIRRGHMPPSRVFVVLEERRVRDPQELPAIAVPVLGDEAHRLGHVDAELRHARTCTSPRSIWRAPVTVNSGDPLLALEAV